MLNDYTEAFESRFTYSGSDLGASWSREKTRFRLWAPTVRSAAVRLYPSGTPGTEDLLEQIPMRTDAQGTWVAEKAGDLNGVYYTYLVDGKTECCDPYARTTGVNGSRAMVIDLSATNPKGWEQDENPHAGKKITDAVIYELHLRDLSTHSSSGMVHTGKYLSLAELGTVTPEGIPTGLDHIRNLGITHVHLQPLFDFGSVDEARLQEPQFNWGYDPVNFNVPEGSYATDPYQGAVRVAQLKQMIRTLHENGIGVIMDVVYNHVYDAGSFCFNRLVPGYFTRPDCNGSGCGNDTATERAMVRKYIVDSVTYWASEYHIDGFRFDLVGLIDTDTINAVMSSVRLVRPGVLFYGEGWELPTKPVKPVHLATQANASLVPGFAFFNDSMRNALRGDLFDLTDRGFVSGGDRHADSLIRSFMGMPSWCKTPLQCVNYASCHDNRTLFDRLSVSNPGADPETLARQNRLCAAINLTAQGIPSLLAGEEMLRSKPLPGGGFDHNSYQSPDSTNCLNWDSLQTPVCQQTLAYYQGLIQFRKTHPALRLTSARAVYTSLRAVTCTPPGVLAFHIRQEQGESIYLIFNSSAKACQLPLPQGQWDIRIDENHAGCSCLGKTREQVTVPPVSALVLTQGEDIPQEMPKKHRLAKKLPILGAAAAAVGLVILFSAKKRKS